MVLSLEFYLGGFATEQGVALSNQRSPPFNCTDCTPLLTPSNEPAVIFARFLEYEGVSADRAATDCATIVGMTPERVLYRNTLSLRQQPATEACRFDIFMWIPLQQSESVHVASYAPEGSFSATRLAQLGSTTADAPGPRTVAINSACCRAALRWTGGAGGSSAKRLASNTARRSTWHKSPRRRRRRRRRGVSTHRNQARRRHRVPTRQNRARHRHRES